MFYEFSLSSALTA